MTFPFLRRLLPVAILLLGLALFFAFERERPLSFEILSRNHAELERWVAHHGPLAALAFIAADAAAVAFSLPVAALVAAASGFLFGPALGALLSIVGATLGAMALFAAARSIFHDVLHARARTALQRLEDGFRRHGFSYLLFLRLVPLFPFWLVNIVAALLGMRFDTFALATAVGIVPAAIVFASAGAGFGSLFDSGQAPGLSAVFQPHLLLPLLGLALLSLLPVLVRGRRKG